MTFYNTQLTYRVVFDMENNLFIAYDKFNSNEATGTTIEQAVQALKKIA